MYFKARKNFSQKLLRKKVDFFLSGVNLSFSLLLGMKKRKLYFLLKKANKINKNLYFSRKELKYLALKLSQFKEKKSKETKIILKLILKIKHKKLKIKKRFFSLFIFIIPFFRKFFDLKQIIRI